MFAANLSEADTRTPRTFCGAGDARYPCERFRCGQRMIATVGSVVGQWEGRGFGWLPNNAATTAIVSSYAELVSLARRASEPTGSEVATA